MLTGELQITTQHEVVRKCTCTITTWLGEGLRWLLLFPVLHLFIDIAADGTDALTKGRSYIFAANHSSHLDAPALLAALPLHLRLQVCVAAAADYFFTSYWKGMLVSLFLNAFAFERKGTGCYASLAHAQQLLVKGHSLLIFPEGSRTEDGQIRHFKQGVGRLASESVGLCGPYLDWRNLCCIAKEIILSTLSASYGEVRHSHVFCTRL